MERNLTIRVDESILKRARHLAVEAGTSLSQWVAGLMKNAVQEEADYGIARERALRRLEQGMSLGGKPLSRDEIHGRG